MVASPHPEPLAQPDENAAAVPPPSPEPRAPRWLHALGALAVLALLARALPTAAEDLRELGGLTSTTLRDTLALDDERRIELALEREDVAAGLPPGTHHELYRALAEYVPRRGEVAFLMNRSHPANRMANRLHALLFPRYIRRLVPGKAPAPENVDASRFAVSFDEAGARTLRPSAKVIAEGKHWKLWQGVPR